MIGVLLRRNDDYTLNKEIYDVITKYNQILIAVYPKTLDEFIKVVNICDGFILQGGNSYEDNEIEYVKYLYENNIPTLGICLGMQMMGLMDGSLNNIGNLSHKSKELYVHEIKIDKNSKLYNTLNKEKIIVNSRHVDSIESTKLNVVAKSNDNIIEAIEDSNKNFFIGVQWHPETIMDNNSINLFNNFFKACKNNHKKNITPYS